MAPLWLYHCWPNERACRLNIFIDINWCDSDVRSGNNGIKQLFKRSETTTKCFEYFQIAYYFKACSYQCVFFALQWSIQIKNTHDPSCDVWCKCHWQLAHSFQSRRFENYKQIITKVSFQNRTNIFLANYPFSHLNIQDIVGRKP